MWKNLVEPDKLQVTIWRMRILFWLHKATNTLSEYVKFIVLTQQQWLHEQWYVICKLRALLIVLFSCKRVIYMSIFILSTLNMSVIPYLTQYIYFIIIDLKIKFLTKFVGMLII